MGSGKYAQKLTYKQWFDFNNAQRAHYNFIEMAPSTFIFLLIAGVYFPIPAAAIGLALAIGRFIYSIGYANGGPKGRLIGALTNDFCLLGLVGLSFASAIMFINGNSNN
jgi:glutathione S-transferase